MALAAVRGGAGNCACARSGIQADQDEAGEVTERIAISWQPSALVGAAMAQLHLAMAPARPQERGRLCSRQPALARQSLDRQRHLDDLAVQPLICVVVNSGAQVFEVTSGAALVAAMLGVGAAARGVHFREPLPAPEVIQAANPFVKLLAVALPSWRAVVHIN